jgi:micrococcal nuclease
MTTPRVETDFRRSAAMSRSSLVRALSLLAAVILASGFSQGRAPAPSDLVGKRSAAHVVGVVDGDTVDVVIPPSRRVRVRIHGIDAPEKGESFSQRATAFMRVLMFARDVVLIGRDMDIHNRLVARVLVDDQDASVALLAAGLGCHYTRFDNDPALASAERRARTAGLGFWAAGTIRPKCAGREARELASRASSYSVGGFTGNVRSRLFHSARCPNSTCANCTKQFTTRAQAEAAGFRPAKDCVAKRDSLVPPR